MSDATRRAAGSETTKGRYELRLYVAGPAPRSIAALRKLEDICAEHLAGRHHIEVIDLLKSPHLAKDDNILAVPTLVRCVPFPVRKIIGNLADATRVLTGLDLRASESDPFTPRDGGSHV
jgi:circadian clock protein KaiB